MFEERLLKAEYLDGKNCDPELIRKSHMFMRIVNKYLGGTQCVKSFIGQLAKNESLKILDIGSGTCDIPIEIAKWAKDIQVQIICIEKNKNAFSLGRQAVISSGLKNIQIIQADIFEFEPEEMFDYAISSMFFHHLTQEQIKNLIIRLRKFVRKSIFINDLHRSFLNYYSCSLLWPLVHRDVLHDALLSIRKGFRSDELKQFENAKVKLFPWQRITAQIDFNGGS